MLDERKRRILRAIVDDYISTAEPVGSRAVARNHDLGVSPATIRNEMADLEYLGYIEQLHTSSGRIPSAKGYRFYVDDLLLPTALSQREVEWISSWYEAKVKRIEEVFQETAKIISRMTRNISLVLAPQWSQAKFRYLQFVPLEARRAIVVIMTDAGFIENKVIHIPENTTLEELRRIADVVNHHLTGLALKDIKASVLRRVRYEVTPDTALFESALEAVGQALTVENRDRVYLGGTTQLISQPEFRDVDKVKELLLVLEEEELLCDLLHGCDGDGISVTIGRENKCSGIQECSVVSATCRVDGQVVGTIAVLGPTRMEYGRIMTLLDFMHGYMGKLLKRYQM